MLAVQPDVCARYVRRPEELAGADPVILPGSKSALGNLVWLRGGRMASGVVQLHRNNVPVAGICGGYQMPGDIIIDEIEPGLGALSGLGSLNTVTHFAQHRTTTLVEGQMSPSLPDWLAGMAGLSVRGYETHMGETAPTDECQPVVTLHKDGGGVADGAVTPDGLAPGTYLHGLFDSDDFT